MHILRILRAGRFFFYISSNRHRWTRAIQTSNFIANSSGSQEWLNANDFGTPAAFGTSLSECGTAHLGYLHHYSSAHIHPGHFAGITAVTPAATDPTISICGSSELGYQDSIGGFAHYDPYPLSNLPAPPVATCIGFGPLGVRDSGLVDGFDHTGAVSGNDGLSYANHGMSNFAY